MVTSHDVAKLAKVSQTTVSRAFRDNCYINPETKQKVLEAAKKLGYYPNYAAKALKHQKSKIIGLLFANANNSFYMSLTQAVESYANERGYRLMLSFTDEDPKKERKYLESFISSRVDGLIYIPVSTDNSDLVDTLSTFDIKVMQFVRELYPQLNTFSINDEYGAYLAVKRLINLGHRQILLPEFDINRTTSKKTAGYLRAFRESGLEADPSLIIYLPFDVDYVSSITYALSEYGATAILSSNSILTVSALKACERLGLSIPDDISFIAYDDNEWLDFMKIDTVAHPMSEIGSQMISSLIDLIENDDSSEAQPQIHTIKPFLLMRNSVKKLSV